MHMKSFRLGFSAANFHDIRYREMRVNRRESELHFVSRDPGKVEQVINQLRLEFDIAPDHAQGSPAILSLRRLGLKRLQCGNDWSEWRAQLVREHGQEMIF